MPQTAYSGFHTLGTVLTGLWLSFVHPLAQSANVVCPRSQCLEVARVGFSSHHQVLNPWSPQPCALAPGATTPPDDN